MVAAGGIDHRVRAPGLGGQQVAVVERTEDRRDAQGLDPRGGVGRADQAAEGVAVAQHGGGERAADEAGDAGQEEMHGKSRVGNAAQSAPTDSVEKPALREMSFAFRSIIGLCPPNEPLPMKTTLDELQAFVAVVDSGSITAAARQLEQTVSGISRALGRLEEKLGTTLLQRTTRRIALSEEGRAFLADARDVLARMDMAEDRMRALRDGPAGVLRVDAATSFLLHVLVPRVAAFRAAYPQITLELTSSDRTIDLLEQRTDIAIRVGPLKDSSLIARHLLDSRLRVLASPAYLAAHGTPADVAALAAHTLLGFTGLPHLNVWPLPADDDEPLVVTPAIAASSGETLRALAVAGAGIACLSDFTTTHDRHAGRLVEVLAGDTRDVRQPVHAVYYRNSGVSSRIRAYVDHLVASLADSTADA